ncbi:biotin transporter BioY [Streptococcus mitis]|nr:biotin transporter BioY [Streptococcus sp. NLN76]
MFTTRDLTKIGLMTSLLIVLGLLPAIPLGFIPVPIVFQNLGVILVGATLGAKKGTFTMQCH